MSYSDHNINSGYGGTSQSGGGDPGGGGGGNNYNFRSVPGQPGAFGNWNTGGVIAGSGNFDRGINGPGLNFPGTQNMMEFNPIAQQLMDMLKPRLRQPMPQIAPPPPRIPPKLPPVGPIPVTPPPVAELIPPRVAVTPPPPGYPRLPATYPSLPTLANKPTYYPGNPRYGAPSFDSSQYGTPSGYTNPFSIGAALSNWRDNPNPGMRQYGGTISGPGKGDLNANTSTVYKQ